VEESQKLLGGTEKQTKGDKQPSILLSYVKHFLISQFIFTGLECC